MSTTLLKYMNALKFISSIKNEKVRKAVLKEFSKKDDFYAALQEIAENTVKKVIPIKPRDKKKLHPFKSDITCFLKNYKSKATKRKKVIQSGGWLNILIPTLFSLLPQLMK
ncbi:MAG: hypothetical protein QM535_22010 [Limnohabitans sp.]|nr:hypothetical protein [Limnohabitans sp.]